MLSHKEGGNSPQINTFFNFFPLGISPHEGMCLLGPVKEIKDIHAEAHEEGEVIVSKIFSEMADVSLENNSMGPLIQYFKYQPGSSPEEGSSGQLSHEHMTGYARGCRVLYDPIAKCMEILGNGNDWSHLYYKYMLICYSLFPFCISFLFIKHEKEIKLIGKLLDWLHWKSDFT